MLFAVDATYTTNTLTLTYSNAATTTGTTLCPTACNCCPPIKFGRPQRGPSKFGPAPSRPIASVAADPLGLDEKVTKTGLPTCMVPSYLVGPNPLHSVVRPPRREYARRRM